MELQASIAIIGCLGTVLMVLVGFVNSRIFAKQLAIAQEQIGMAVHQLEMAQRASDLQIIPRSIQDSTDHIRILLEKPHLRPYFYDDAEWREGDVATHDEVKLFSELLLNSFVSSILHSAAFPAYPVRGIDRIIEFHLRHSPALRDFLTRHFERFPFSGLTLLCYKARSRDEVLDDLRKLTDAPDLDPAEKERRASLLLLYESSPHRDPIDFAALNMARRQ